MPLTEGYPTVLQIADAVVQELAQAPAGTFVLPFTPQRRVLPVFDLEQLKDLHVTVVPRAVEISAATRSLSQHDVQVDVGVQARIPVGQKDLDAELSPLLGLVEQISTWLRRRPLTNLPWAAWTSTANDPIYAPEHLNDQRVFTSVLTLTYRLLQ
jgi:hypothetical protein